jgi:hypothetical protein
MTFHADERHLALLSAHQSRCFDLQLRCLCATLGHKIILQPVSDMSGGKRKLGLDECGQR